MEVDRDGVCSHLRGNECTYTCCKICKDKCKSICNEVIEYRERRRYILNSAVITTEGIYEYEIISAEEAQQWHDSIEN